MAFLFAVTYAFILQRLDVVQIRGSDISCDESALTGESDEVKKSTETHPFLLSGTAVMKGTGLMLVTCVGLFSEEGIIQKLITGVGHQEVCHNTQLKEPPESPL
jgi:Ca2+ transporting ATPase